MKNSSSNNLILPKYLILVKKKGSSLALPANGLGGSRATSFLVAHFTLQNTASNPAEKNRAKPEKQKGKKEGGLGEEIFALLRLRIERFRFSLIKRNTKQKIFQFLLKEKNGGQKKIKNVMKKFLFWFAVAERRQAETHQLNYHALRAYDLVQSHHARGACVSRGSVQKKLEFQPKGTAN